MLYGIVGSDVVHGATRFLAMNRSTVRGTYRSDRIAARDCFRHTATMMRFFEYKPRHEADELARLRPFDAANDLDELASFEN